MSKLIETRAEFRGWPGEIRLDEAKSLLDLGKWGGALQKRYHRIDKAEAEALYTAIADSAHGVLPWIKTQW